MLAVLMLDDDRCVAEALARPLRRHGIALDFSSDLAPFLLRVREGSHRVLVLDELMPAELGSTTCLRLRQGGEKRPIVLTSALAGRPDGEELAEIAEECGAHAFCEKRSDALARAIFRLDEDPGPHEPVPVRRLRFAHVFTREPIAVEGLDLDRVVFRGSEALTPLGHRALSMLLQLAPAEVPADALVRRVWGCQVGASTVSNLMRKLIDLPGDWIERTPRGWRARVVCVRSTIHRAYATALATPITARLARRSAAP